MTDPTTSQVEIKLRWDVMGALLASVLAFLLQAAAGVWYASQFDARLRSVETAQSVGVEEFKKLEIARESNAVQFQEIKDKLDLLLSQPRGGGQ